MNSVLLKNGRVIDPANKRDGTGDVLIIDGRIADLAQRTKLATPPEEIDCTGLF